MKVEPKPDSRRLKELEKTVAELTVEKHTMKNRIREIMIATGPLRMAGERYAHRKYTTRPEYTFIPFERWGVWDRYTEEYALRSDDLVKEDAKALAQAYNKREKTRAKWERKNDDDTGDSGA